MRIAVICNDTRGGIQPYIALALGLKAAGHTVRVVAPSNFSQMLVESELPFASLSVSDEEVKRISTGVAEKGTLASMVLMAREMPLRLQLWTRETLEACEDMDILTGGIGGMVVGLSVAEKLKKPFVEAHLQPIGVETDAYPGVLLPWLPQWIGSSGIRFSHRLSDFALWTSFKMGMSLAREKVLNLKGSMPALTGPVLYGFSRYVIEVPSHDARARHVTGYWSLPTPKNWLPPPGLSEFLTAGGPVVAIGFGSMSSRSPTSTTALISDAVSKAQVRAVLLEGWGKLKTSNTDENIFCIESAPHDWLFPRVTAVVHHGGAGTTGAALTAGVPAIVVPFGMDQPFWGARVAVLGVGPSPIPRPQLTSERLSAAIKHAVDDESMRLKASNLGLKIRAENGVAAAVEQFARLT